MQNNRVYFFIDAVSRRTGGGSSILDLANSFIELGYDVEFRTLFGKLDNWIYRAEDVNKNIRLRALNSTIYSNYRKLQFVKLFLNKLIYLFSGTRDSIESSLIIDCCFLNNFTLNEFKSKRNIVILNHAGSIKAFVRFFVGKTEISDQVAYRNFLTCYNYLLFQSPTQLKESKLVLNRDIHLLLRPSVSVNQISNYSNKNLFDNNCFNIVVVGSIQPRKGQQFLPEIYTKLVNSGYDVVIHVVGAIVDNEYYKMILSSMMHFRSNSIVFYGHKSNYIEYINSADLLLQISEEEGVSRILREAMFLGKPILSFNLEGTSDLLENNFDSVLVEKGDINAITEQIVYLIKNPDFKLKIGNNAKSNFDLKYSKEFYFNNLKDILKEISYDI